MRLSVGFIVRTAAALVAVGEAFVTLSFRPPGPVSSSWGAAPEPWTATPLTCERRLSVNVFAAAAVAPARSVASFPPRVSPPLGAEVMAPALIAAVNGPALQPPTCQPLSS